MFVWFGAQKSVELGNHSEGECNDVENETEWKNNNLPQVCKEFTHL
jgi:hypothetical protein